MRHLARYTALVLLAVASACQTDSTSPSPNVVGTYFAQRINDAPLPAPVQTNTAAAWFVTSAALRLNSNGTWRLVYPMRTTPTPGDTVYLNPVPDDSGTYTLSGSTITFVDVTSGRSPFTGTASSSTVTFSTGFVNLFAFRSIQFSRQDGL